MISYIGLRGCRKTKRKVSKIKRRVSGYINPKGLKALLRNRPKLISENKLCNPPPKPWNVGINDIDGLTKTPIDF